MSAEGQKKGSVVGIGEEQSLVGMVTRKGLCGGSEGSISIEGKRLWSVMMLSEEDHSNESVGRVIWPFFTFR